MYLGIDLGTSELKALLLDASHRVLASARAPLTVSRPQPLWSEQSPAQWQQALETVMHTLCLSHQAELRAVRGIGLSGHMHGAVLLDSSGEVLRPAILWNDGRSMVQCRELEQAVPGLSRITGNLAMPGFTAPKLLWLRQHEPGIFTRVAKVLLPKDWLRFWLSGEAVTEMSDASGTLWLDVGRRDWSGDMLAACGLAGEQMPRLVEGSDISARLKPAIAARWGLGSDVLIAGGAGDNAASAVGMGLIEPGQGFVSLGTSGVIFVVSKGFEPRPAQAVHAFCHALPGRWHQMSVMLSAASALSWASRNFGFSGEAGLLQAASQLDAGQRAKAPLFLPYLSGERSPHNNPQAQGVLFGLTHSHQSADIAYAVVEGVCFGLRDGLETLTQPAQSLVLVGGGARSAWWAQLLADILQVPLVLNENAEAGGALGAARLAWLADGGDLAQVCVAPVQRQCFRPDAAQAAAHGLRHARFRALYASLRESFQAL